MSDCTTLHVLVLLVPIGWGMVVCLSFVLKINKLPCLFLC